MEHSTRGNSGKDRPQQRRHSLAKQEHISSKRGTGRIQLLGFKDSCTDKATTNSEAIAVLATTIAKATTGKSKVRLIMVTDYLGEQSSYQCHDEYDTATAIGTPSSTKTTLGTATKEDIANSVSELPARRVPGSKSSQCHSRRRKRRSAYSSGSSGTSKSKTSTSKSKTRS